MSNKPDVKYAISNVSRNLDNIVDHFPKIKRLWFRRFYESQINKMILLFTKAQSCACPKSKIIVIDKISFANNSIVNFLLVASSSEYISFNVTVNANAACSELNRQLGIWKKRVS